MSQYKARIDFTDEQDADLIPIAQNVHDTMVTNAGTFGSPPLTMVVLQTAINDYQTKLSAAANRGKTEVAAKNAARTVLEDDLRSLGHYVNTVAGGDRATVDLGGFPGYESRHGQSRDLGMVSNVTFQPSNLRMIAGANSGVIKFMWQSDGSGTGCEVQTTVTDPGQEAGWTYKGVFTGGKCDIGGFSPGATVWGRVRKVGRHGETGPWSDPAKVMVT